MHKFASLILIIAVLVPLAIAIGILFRNEMHIEKDKTGGYGLPVLIGFIIVFIVMPLIAYLTS